ncbi:GRAM domain-containing protein 1C [Thelohanellus kitauei]|uniref:GRAM domain-containing protein 1C n=1 Tax=Thelohanellus kitauei TaxID=669202 RepID=A0A0C2MQ80_THEKT|nr:GRAM domain-containing protein 1C [Thelohanellus kitauei]
MIPEPRVSTLTFSPTDSKILKINALKLKFSDITDTEEIINDFSCALKRDLLTHGRLYIGLENLYFLSSILRFETKVIEKWSNILSVEKAKLANIIPNSIRIVTPDNKYLFTSFVSRTYPYELINYAIRNQKEKLELKSSQIRDIVKSQCLNQFKNVNNSKLQSSDSIAVVNMGSQILVEPDTNSDSLVNSSADDGKLDILTLKSTSQNFVLKSTAANCPCQGLKHLLVKKLFKVHIDDIFNVLYDDSSFMMKNVYEKCCFQGMNICNQITN